MIDLSLLRILKYRGDFFRIRKRIPDAAVDKNTVKILDTFEVYFDRFPEHTVIDIPTMLPVFRSLNTGMKEETRQAFEQILKTVKTDVDEDTKSTVMQFLLELRLGTSIALLLEQWDAGDLPNIHAALREATDEFELDADIKSLDYLRPDIRALINASLDENGLQWSLTCLREAMRGLRGGDFGIIAARPDKGKTTFLVSECMHLLKQLPLDRNLIWLNNEGPGDRIYMRAVQGALGLKQSELRALDAASEGGASAAFFKAIGGDTRLRVVDIHGLDTYAVENIIRNNAAGLVVFDMIDNIRGFGDSARTDLALEKMYGWARELCVKYDFIGLATSQISNDGDGMQFPTLGMLKDSKTGKQGACDFQLMIGASNDPNLAGMRYIGLPKNKLRREGARGDPRATVNFRPQIARFDDVPIDPTTEE